MEEERKARWKREIDWLLSVTDHIVEFIPTQQTLENGTMIEVKFSLCSHSKTCK
jgi:PRONE (Plant-specific Rop nucleotide exchanger)